MLHDNTPAEISLIAALATLKGAGRRITGPRKSLLELLIASDRPATIEAIFGHLPAGSFDLVTLYRNLEVLEEVGLVRRTFLCSGTTTFMNERGGSVFHLATRKTGKVTLICAEDAKELEQSLAAVVARLEGEGYRNVRHSAQFFVDESSD